MKSQPKDEKFTPLKYIISVKEVLGTIDLDPFSCEKANKRIKAVHFLNKEINAFTRNWYGKIFANPPYSRGHLSKVSQYLTTQWVISNVKEAIYLVPNSTEQSWFQHLLTHDFPVCLTDHRIAFINGLTERSIIEENPENGSAFFYLGKNPMKFYEVFKKWGAIVNIVQP